jgi:hypothetical protein
VKVIKTCNFMLLLRLMMIGIMQKKFSMDM